MVQNERAVRTLFVSWAANQNPPAAIFLPEVSISGKKIDLVCVEEPFDAKTLVGPGSQLIKRFRFETWQTTYQSLRPDMERKLLTIDNRSMNSIAQQLIGTSVWLVELKQVLSFEALGQILGYRYWFNRNYPNVQISRCIVGCTRTDSVIEEVCTQYRIETVVL